MVIKVWVLGERVGSRFRKLSPPWNRSRLTRASTKNRRRIAFEMLEDRRLLSSNTPRVDLYVPGTERDEGDRNLITLGARISGRVDLDDGPFRFPIRMSGEGITDDDYVLPTTVITIPRGADSASVVMTIVDDDVVENHVETIRLRVVDPSGRFVAHEDAAELSIHDDDAAVLTLSGGTFREDRGTVEFVAKLSNPVDVDVKARFRTRDLSAVSGQDFVGLEEQEILFPAGQTEVSVFVDLVDDATDHGTRVFEGVLTSIDAQDRNVSFGSERLDWDQILPPQVGQIAFTNDGESLISVIDGYLYRTATDGSTEPEKIEGPRHVTGFRISPNDETIFYNAKQESIRATDTYHMPLDGSSPPVKISTAWATGLPRVSVDGRWLLYFDRDENLYSAPVDGSSPPIQLNRDLPGINGINEVRDGITITDDNRRVVFLAAGTTSNRYRLYSALLDGSEPAVLLRGTAAYPTSVTGYQVTRAGTHVVFRGYEAPGRLGIFEIPVDGSTPARRLSQALSAERQVTQYLLGPDGMTLAYILTDSSVDVQRMFVTHLDDDSVHREIAFPGSAAGLGFSLLSFTDDGKSLFFRSKQAAEPFDLKYFIAPIDGSSPATRINNIPVGDQNLIHNVSLSPNQDRIIYTLRIDGQRNLYSATLDGSAEPVQLTESSPNNWRVSYRYTNDPDLVYILVTDTDSPNRLFRRRIDGLGPLELIAESGRSDVTDLDYVFSKDGSKVAYSVSRVDDGTFPDLPNDALFYRDAASVGAATEVSLPSTVTGTPIESNVKVDDNGQFAVFQSQPAHNSEYFQLKSRPLGSSSEALALTPRLRTESLRDFRFQIGPEGRHVVYTSDQDQAGVVELYSVPIDGSSPPRRISKVVGQQGGVDSDFIISHAGSRVIYCVHEDEALRYSLHSVPVDGSSDPVVLSPSASETDDVSSKFQLTPDGTAVVFMMFSSGNHDLYSVPIDRSSDPVNLTRTESDLPDTLLSGESLIGSLQFTPGGDRVVYASKGESAYDFGVYSVPLDGTLDPSQLGVKPIVSSDGRLRRFDFHLSPDGKHAVFFSNMTDPLPSGSYTGDTELFSVSLDDPDVVARISHDLGRGEELVSRIAFSEDGQFVFYVSGSDFGNDPPYLYRSRVSPGANQDAWRIDVSFGRDDANRYRTQFWVPEGIDGITHVTPFYDGDGDSIQFRTVIFSDDNETNHVTLFESPWIEVYNSLDVEPGPNGRSIRFVPRHSGLVEAPIDGSASLQAPGVFGAFGGTGIERLFNAEFVPGRSEVIAPTANWSDIRNVYLVGQLAASATAKIVDNDGGPFDYGDAPASTESGFAGSYPVLLAQDGARHLIGSASLYLGSIVDADDDGQSHGNATGDENDEDGVILVATATADEQAATSSSLSVVASGGGKLDAWVDFNRDGDWDDSDERILDSVDVSAGDNLFRYGVPSGASGGMTYARFRISSEGSLSPDGVAADGEVEDHQVYLSSANESVVRIRGLPSRATSVASNDGVLTVDSDDFRLYSSRVDVVSGIRFEGTDADDTIAVSIDLNQVGNAIQVIGGAGNDSLMLNTTQRDIDLSDTMKTTIEGIDVIDLKDGIANSITFASSQLSDLPDSGGKLTMLVDRDDSMRVLGGESFELTLAVGEGQFLVKATSDLATIVFDGTEWMNPLNPLDVDARGGVTSGDALTVVNELQRTRFVLDDQGTLVEPESVPEFPGRFFDVSGDGRLSAIDVLRVINHLQRQQIAESEVPFELPPDALVVRTLKDHASRPTASDDPSVVVPDSPVRRRGASIANQAMEMDSISVISAEVTESIESRDHAWSVDAVLTESWDDFVSGASPKVQADMAEGLGSTGHFWH